MPALLLIEDTAMKTLLFILALCTIGHPLLPVPALSEAPGGMVHIRGGVYQPPLKDKAAGSVKVQPFYIARYAVTNGEYLEFVKQNTAWQRSRVKGIFADRSYLRQWAGDLDLGSASAKAPVTNISWFAARAYAKWKGMRLPTTAEWEIVGMASASAYDASKDSVFLNRILSWYSQPSQPTLPDVGTGFKNIWGVSDMHGLIWEWVEDFNTAMVTGDSRGNSGMERELFCGSASLRAADARDYAAFMRFGFRSSLAANYCVRNLGFRCAKDIRTPQIQVR